MLIYYFDSEFIAIINYQEIDIKDETIDLMYYPHFQRNKS